MDLEDNKFKFLGPDTYKSSYLSIDAKCVVFIAYHIMGLRDGDTVPSTEKFKVVAEEHGIDKFKSLEDLICYERWLYQDN